MFLHFLGKKKGIVWEKKFYLSLDKVFNDEACFQVYSFRRSYKSAAKQAKERERYYLI